MDEPSSCTPLMEIDVAQALGQLRLDVCCNLSSRWSVLFGPSAAGKTSLLRILCGLIKPQRGRITLRGRVLTDVPAGIDIPAAQRRIGFVSQQPALFQHMDVAANIGFGLHGMSRPARQCRIEEMLHLFAAEALAGRKPEALSGGEKQRVALARALAPEPQMLLLDEPFSGTDSTLKESILGNLTAWLEAREICTIYVSHDLAEVFQTGGDVLVLREGRIAAQGPAGVVLARERERLLAQMS